MTHPNALDLRAMIAASEGICDDLEAEGYSGAIIRRTLRALIKERDEAAERIEELQAACEVVSSEFEGELWVVCRRILKKTGFDFHSDDGVQAAVFEEHINETLADLKFRAEAAESKAQRAEEITAAVEGYWIARVEAAESRVKELEADMLPLVELLASIPIREQYADDLPVVGVDGVYITQGHVRSARAAINKKGSPQ